MHASEGELLSRISRVCSSAVKNFPRFALLDEDDLSQEVWLRWSKARVRPGYEEATDGLFRKIATNILIDAYRSGVRRIYVPLADGEAGGHLEDPQVDRTEVRITIREILEFVRHFFSENHYQFLTLSLEGRSQREIASAMKLAESTVSGYMNDLKDLQSYLGEIPFDDDDDDPNGGGRGGMRSSKTRTKAPLNAQSVLAFRQKRSLSSSALDSLLTSTIKRSQVGDFFRALLDLPAFCEPAPAKVKNLGEILERLECKSCETAIVAASRLAPICPVPGVGSAPPRSDVFVLLSEANAAPRRLSFRGHGDRANTAEIDYDCTAAMKLKFDVRIITEPIGMLDEDLPVLKLTLLAACSSGVAKLDDRVKNKATATDLYRRALLDEAVLADNPIYTSGKKADEFNLDDDCTAASKFRVLHGRTDTAEIEYGCIAAVLAAAERRVLRCRADLAEIDYDSWRARFIDNAGGYGADNKRPALLRARFIECAGDHGTHGKRLALFNNDRAVAVKLRALRGRPDAIEINNYRGAAMKLCAHLALVVDTGAINDDHIAAVKLRALRGRPDVVEVDNYRGAAMKLCALLANAVDLVYTQTCDIERAHAYPIYTSGDRGTGLVTAGRDAKVRFSGVDLRNSRVNVDLEVRTRVNGAVIGTAGRDLDLAVGAVVIENPQVGSITSDTRILGDGQEKGVRLVLVWAVDGKRLEKPVITTPREGDIVWSDAPPLVDHEGNVLDGCNFVDGTAAEIDDGWSSCGATGRKAEYLVN